MPPRNLDISINADASLHTHIEQLILLDQASIDSPNHIHLTLYGLKPLSMSTAGSFLSAMARCQKAGATIASSAYTPLVGPIAYLWFASDLRRIAPSAYILVPASHEPVRGADAGPYMPERPLDTLISEGEQVAQEYCRKIIERHVSDQQIQDQILGIRELSELLLIGALPECIVQPVLSSTDKTNGIFPKRFHFNQD